MTDDDHHHAFSWLNGVAGDLGAFNGADTWATAVSDSGVIAGLYAPGGSALRPFVYSSDK